MIIKCNAIEINTNINNLFYDFENTNNNCVLKFNLEYVESFKDDKSFEKLSYIEGFEYLFVNDNTIYVNTNNVEYIETSLFSTPLSILAIFNNMFLLHCSSIFLDENIISFSGQSGSGKTTLLLNLINKFNLNVFSDDSILLENVDNNIYCYQVLPLIKLNDDTAKKIKININKNKIYKKTLLMHKFENNKKILNSIFIIKRSNDFHITKINNIFSKIISLANLMVGKDFLNSSIIEKSFKIRKKIAQNINIYTLSIDSYNEKHLESLYDFIKKELTKNE